MEQQEDEIYLAQSKYAGMCVICDEKFQAGDPIFWNKKAPKGENVRHEVCPKDRPTKDTPPATVDDDDDLPF